MSHDTLQHIYRITVEMENRHRSDIKKYVNSHWHGAPCTHMTRHQVMRLYQIAIKRKYSIVFETPFQWSCGSNIFVYFKMEHMISLHVCECVICTGTLSRLARSWTAIAHTRARLFGLLFVLPCAWLTCNNRRHTCAVRATAIRPNRSCASLWCRAYVWSGVMRGIQQERRGGGGKKRRQRNEELLRFFSSRRLCVSSVVGLAQYSAINVTIWLWYIFEFS